MADTELASVEELLHDVEYRRAFGFANVKLDLALAVVEARRQKKMTQEELAHQSGVSQPYIAKLESGEANPTIGAIGALLAVMWLKPQIMIAPLGEGKE